MNLILRLYVTVRKIPLWADQEHIPAVLRNIQHLSIGVHRKTFLSLHFKRTAG